MKTSFLLLCIFVLVVSKNLRFTEDEETETPTYEEMNTLQKADFWVTSITNAFNDCKKFLTFSNSKNVAYYWKGVGFSNLNMKGKIEVTEGIDEAYWSKYKKLLRKFYKVPDEYQKYFDALNILDEFQDESAWQKADLSYDAKNEGKDNYLRSYSFMFTHTDLGEVDAVNICMDVKFDLAPDTIVWRKSQTKFGAAWTKVEDSIEKRPRSITEDDIEVIVIIAELLSFRFVGKQLGLFFDISDIEELYEN